VAAQAAQLSELTGPDSSLVQNSQLEADLYEAQRRVKFLSGELKAMTDKCDELERELREKEEELMEQQGMIKMLRDEVKRPTAPPGTLFW